MTGEHTISATIEAGKPLPIDVDVISDVVCPWCFLGKRRIERAIAMTPAIAVTLSWKPYQLDPTIPTGGYDRGEYMRRKFGSDEKLDAIHARISAAGEADGIAFRFDRIRRSPNTLDAHRLIRWAGEADAEAEASGAARGTAQGAVVEALFSRYFIEGDDVGAPEVLVDIARKAGLNGDRVAALLAGDQDAERVQADIAASVQLGVTGVPCFILAGKLAIPGAQDPDTLSRYMERLARKIAAGTVPAEGSGA